MAHISLKHVQPGMVLAADAVAAGNRLLHRAGSEITEAPLQTLRMWDVFGVDVQGVSREDVVARAAAQLDAATRDAIECELDTYFRFADRSHPLIDELIHLARLRMVLEACGSDDGT
jgi:Mn-dependent DtxR family transcriptional regulator